MTKVLLIEDEVVSRKALLRFLQDNRFEVQAAPDSNAALALAREFAPDVLVSDWWLKGSVTAESVVRDLYARYPHLAIIILTGFSAENLRAELTGLPVRASLVKPALLEDVRSAIQEAVI